MSRGHGRLQRIILQSVNATRYGCTVRQLAYLSYGSRGEDGPSEAQLSVVDKAVRRLVEEERVVERAMFGTEPYIMPASPAMPTTGSTMLQCVDCDLRWVSEEGAPHLLCWSCGELGETVNSQSGRAGARRTPKDGRRTTHAIHERARSGGDG